MLKIGKITIIGSGRVGTSTAFALVCQNIAKEVSMLDINEDILEAECLDLRDAKYFSYTGHVHKGVWEEAKNSQIIVLCAGEVLRPESSVHQVVNANKRIFDDIFGRLGKINNNTVLVVATSPVDPMTQYAQKLSGLPKSQVLGTGTLLDTQRLRVKLGKKFQINEKSVHAYVMGEKGDTSFVPWSHASIAGRKLSEYFSEDRETQSQLLDAFVNKIKRKTDRILSSKHGTNFGIAACIAAICKDIIYDTNAILPLSCWVNEYNCYMSVLCTLGEKGITKIIPLDLTEKEKSCFYNCSTSIWHTLKWLGFEREGFGAVGEKKGFDEKMGMTPRGGLTREESVTGTSVDFGRGQDIGGGLGTDIGGFGKKSFEPLQTNEGWRDEGIGASLKDYGTTLGTTDIRGIGLSKKETDVSSGVISDLSTKPELVGATETTGLGRDIGKTTEVTEKKAGTFTTSELGYDIGAPKELGKDFGKTDIGTGLGPDVGTGLESKELGTPQLGVGNVLSKPLDTDLGIGKEVSGGGLGTPGTTDLGTGGDLTDISPTSKDTSFGGGLGVGQKTELGADVEQGMKKDVSGEFGEKKKLVTEEGVNEPVGRPIRQ